MRPSTVVPWRWTLESGLSPRDALRFYDTRVEERMSNPEQGYADMWSGPFNPGRRRTGVLHGHLGGGLDADVIVGRFLPDVRR